MSTEILICLENQMPSPPKITAYSTALFASWYFVHEYRVLFDCGDGVSAELLQKAQKIKHCFISHADRDHVTGLLQFLQLNGASSLTIHYPADSGSFPALRDFTAKFDPHVTGTRWNPLRPGNEVFLREDLRVRPILNRHIAAENGETKSLSFIVESIRRKLKPEFASLSGPEIGAFRKEHGADAVTDVTRATELIYSGDTPIESDGRYNNAKVLIHEATFLTREEIDPDNPRRNKHSSLDAVMEMVSESNIGTLILGHFSSRYSHEQIDEAIDKEIIRCGIRCKVQRIYPGRVYDTTES